MSPLAYLKLGAVVLVLTILSAGASWLIHHEREIGRAEIRAKWDAERVALQAEVQAQKDRNRELQRAAEERYTVVAEVRDRFITKIVTEVRDATESLAACPVGVSGVRLLNDASRCASEDRPASCGAGDGVHPAQ